ncbi:MAG: hypothetical protein I8H68_07470 [Flavobacteriia bacterium]|nr:hypothetical protein [Flavobacteriia bacterium]
MKIHSFFLKNIKRGVGCFFIICFSFLKSQTIDLEYSQQLILRNQVDSAIVILNKSITKTGTEKEKAFVYLELGNAYKQKQDYEKSFANYQKALRIFKDQNHPQETFFTYVHLAEFFRYRRQYKTAQSYLDRCEDIVKKTRVKDDYLMKFYSRKAALFSEYVKNRDSALVYSRRALSLSEKTGNIEAKLISLMEIAGVLEYKKQYAEAIKQLEEIISITKENGNVQLQCDAMVNLCRNYNRIGNDAGSLETSLEGLALAEQKNISYNQLLFADNLQQVYNKTGDFKNAYQYLLLRMKLTEAYYNRLYDHKVLEYEEKFKAAEKEKIIFNGEKLLKLKEAEIRRQNLIRSFILLAMIFTLVFLAVLVYYIRVIKKQNRELQFISDQNEFLVSETHHRVNNNLQLITILIENEFKKISDADPDARKKILAKIDSMGVLHRQLYTNQDKKSLDMKEFLAGIKKNVEDLFQESGVYIDFDVEELRRPVNQAMYFGLLVTELCINSIKHAFADQKDKTIRLNFFKDGDYLRFVYADNGRNTGEIPKLVLIEKLCRQLGVDYAVEGSSGFNFSFKIKQ